MGPSKKRRRGEKDLRHQVQATMPEEREAQIRDALRQRTALWCISRQFPKEVLSTKYQVVSPRRCKLQLA